MVVNDESLERILTGRSTPPSDPIALRAGHLEMLLVDGDLRYIRARGIEVVRRVYVAVRDLDWNTLPGKIEVLRIRDHGISFDVTFRCRHRISGVDYRWSAGISGDALGCIRYEMSGQALSQFPYAKIGICVHHPTHGFAGLPLRGVGASGEVTAELPDTIGPQIQLEDGTDQPLFDAVSELQLSHESGGTVTFEFAGDLWEMEDQRNWTDASYKSVSTPACLGYRHEAVPGQHFHQSVAMTTTGFLEASAPTIDSVALGAASTTFVPRIGLTCNDPASELSSNARRLLGLVRPAHLRVDLDLGPAGDGPLVAATERAAELRTPLELCVFLPSGQRPGELDWFRRRLQQLRPSLARILLFSADEESTSRATVEEFVGALGPILDVPVIAGTNMNFNELNRHRLDPGPASGIVWSINPQVHAFDELSLVENLQAQSETVTTARSFAEGRTLHVSPITLRPRFNAVASTDNDFRIGDLPWSVDPRQSSLFAAAWTLGSIAALSAVGTDSLTYYDIVGPRGFVEAPEGSASPEEFRSLPDTAFPLVIILADACDLQGARVVEVSGFDPLRIAVLAAQTSAGRTILSANMTRHEITVDLGVGAGASGTIRVLDATTVGEAIKRPDEFLASGDRWACLTGIVNVRLGPYACVRVDVVDARPTDTPGSR